jgi:hypothetical protein
MPLEPTEVARLIAEVHIPSLNDAEVNILAAAIKGWKSPEIAERVFLTDREVRRILERLTDMICRAAGTNHAAGPVTLWTVMHRNCRYRCSATVCASLDFGADYSSAT